MKLHPRVTRSVVELVKRFEGLRRRAARLADGGWTIGYGHTRSARDGAVVSPEDADALLYYDLSEVADKVEAWTFTPLNQNQFEALTAFAFNIGVENFRSSAVLKRVNEGHHLLAASALELWRKADFEGEGLVVDGLVRRRAAEKAHYLTPPEGFRPTPTPVLKPTLDHSMISADATPRFASNAAIVDAPLEGDLATATVRDGPEPEGAPIAPFPYASTSADLVAEDGTPGKLHQLFPEEDAKHPPELAPVSLAPFGELNAAPAGVQAVNDSALRKPVALAAIEPPPFANTAAQADVAQSPPAAKTGPLAAISEKMVDHPQSGLLQRRSAIYLVVGALGLLLLAAAVFTMLRGGANSANLIIGLIGIALLAPAAGNFIQKFARDRTSTL